MRSAFRIGFLALAAITVIVGCAPQGGGSPAGGGGPASARGAKRVVAAVQDDIPMVFQKLNPASRYRGVDGVQDLLAAGLSQAGLNGDSIPELADAMPSTDKGTWKVATDGTMETTWKIRP